MKDSSLTISYKLNDRIDKNQITDLFGQLVSIAKKNGKLNLIVETYQIDNLRNISSLFSSIKKTLVLKHLKKFALITNTDWRSEVVQLVDLLNSEIEMEVFDLVERVEANAWVRTTNVKENYLGPNHKNGYAHLVHLV